MSSTRWRSSVLTLGHPEKGEFGFLNCPGRVVSQDRVFLLFVQISTDGLRKSAMDCVVFCLDLLRQALQHRSSRH